MGYNVIDVIDKAINIENKEKSKYKNIGKQKGDVQSIKIMSTVFVKQADKTIEYYKTLKKELKGLKFEDIDFDVYDRMSFLVNEFNKKKYSKEINGIEDVKDYLKFSLNLEKDIYSLFVDIKGRFVKNTSDVNTKTYEILSDIVDNKANSISMLEKALQ